MINFIMFNDRIYIGCVFYVSIIQGIEMIFLFGNSDDMIVYF